MKQILLDSIERIQPWLSGQILFNFASLGKGYEEFVDDEIYLKLVQNHKFLNAEFYIQYSDVFQKTNDILDIALINTNNYNVIADIELQHNSILQPDKWLINHCVSDIRKRLKSGFSNIYTISILTSFISIPANSSIKVPKKIKQKEINIIRSFHKLDNNVQIKRYHNLMNNYKIEIVIFICGPFKKSDWTNIQTDLNYLNLDELKLSLND